MLETYIKIQIKRHLYVFLFTTPHHFKTSPPDLPPNDFIFYYIYCIFYCILIYIFKCWRGGWWCRLFLIDYKFIFFFVVSFSFFLFYFYMDFFLITASPTPSPFQNNLYLYKIVNLSFIKLIQKFK